MLKQMYKQKCQEDLRWDIWADSLDAALQWIYQLQDSGYLEVHTCVVPLVSSLWRGDFLHWGNYNTEVSGSVMESFSFQRS